MVSEPTANSTHSRPKTTSTPMRPRPGLLSSPDTGVTALSPSSESSAGSSQTAESMTSSTVPLAARARPLKKSMPMTNSPSRAMITVAAAKTTARPEVLTDSMAASLGSCPACTA